MQNQVEYKFASEPDAYRFLNTVAHWDVPQLKVKLGRSAYHVIVSYSMQPGDFDATLSQLDDLAAKENGEEQS